MRTGQEMMSLEPEERPPLSALQTYAQKLDPAYGKRASACFASGSMSVLCAT